MGLSAAVGATEGFEVRVLNGVPYWNHFGARLVPFAWVAIESFRYRNAAGSRADTELRRSVSAPPSGGGATS